MHRDVLIISTMQSVAQFATLVAQQTGADVEFADNRRAGLSALRRTQFDVVIVEESLIEGDPEWAELFWQNTGTAMPVQINFAISGSMRLAREVRAALHRRAADKELGRRAAAAEMANDLKTPVTGLLLQSELALRDPSMSAALEPKLRNLVELAGVIRERLRPEA